MLLIIPLLLFMAIPLICLNEIIKLFKNNNLKKMEKYHGNTIEYWKNNAEEDYITTPISVLKYITVLEEQANELRLAANNSSTGEQLPNGEIAISSKALTDPNWTDKKCDC